MIYVCSTFQVSNSERERGFSLMNSMKSKTQNKLGIKYLDNIIRNKSYLLSKQKIDFSKVYNIWIHHKKQ